MRQQRLLYLALLILLIPYHLLAWGHAGHAMVAELAMSMLSDATRVKVERVLNGMTAEQAGNWMDEVRFDPKYKYTAPWHFVNIEPGGTYQPAPNGDIITALNKAYTELQHPEKLSPEQLKFDVLVLFHLCGDLLQPLHVGYGSDKCGNTYQINYNGKGTNLHHIWDSEIIEKENITFKGDFREHKHVLPKRIVEWTPNIDFMFWLEGGRNLLPQLYNIKGHKLDDVYLHTNRSVVVNQIKWAGMLLAACLEELFSQMKNMSVGPPVTTSSASQKPENAGKTLAPPAPSPRTRQPPTLAKR